MGCNPESLGPVASTTQTIWKMLSEARRSDAIVMDDPQEPADKASRADEKAFNETLKRMLKTPPKQHQNVGQHDGKRTSADKPKGARQSSRRSAE